MSTPRILAIDPGQRRIGLAISSESGLGAKPLFTLHRGSERADLKAIARFLRQHHIEQILVGLPLNMDGSRGPAAEKAERFADLLRAQHPQVPVQLVDERLTTHEAHARLDAMERGGVEQWTDRVSREERIDQVAAAILLESYLAMEQPLLLPDPGAQ